jgi:hypothetical protein
MGFSGNCNVDSVMKFEDGLRKEKDLSERVELSFNWGRFHILKEG